MNGNSPGSNQETPEVESRTALKGAEDHDIDLENVEHCNGVEASYRHCNGEGDMLYSPTVTLTGETVGHTCLCYLST